MENLFQLKQSGQNPIISKLHRKAEESFEWENQVYKLLNDENFNFNSFDSFIQYIIKNGTDELQKALREKVFNMNDKVASFIDILYKQQVRDKLTRAGNANKVAILDTSSLQQLTKEFKAGGIVIGNNASFLTDEQKKQYSMPDFLKRTADQIYEKLSSNIKGVEAYIGKNIEQYATSDDGKSFPEVLKEHIYRSLEAQSFEISARAVNKNKAVIYNGENLSIPTSNVLSKKLPGFGRTIKTQQRKNGTEVYQLVPLQEPLMELQTMVDNQTINDQKQDIEFVISLNMPQKQMETIVKNALDSFADDENSTQFLTVNSSPEIEVQGGMIALKYNANKNNYDNVIDKIIDAYGISVQEAIKDYEVEMGLDDTASEEFMKWFNEKRPNFKTIIEKNKHIQQEILKAASVAQVSGTILGEVMYSLLASGGRLSESNGNNISILGQNQTASGQAAVDISIDLKGKKVGFQIKTFPSVKGSTFLLYGQSNRLMDQVAMRRYLDQDSYDALVEIFFPNTNKPPIPVYYSKEAETQEAELQKALSILMLNIPGYIRYEQMDLEDQPEKNNFYVINYQFVPASVIFYLLEQAVLAELNSVKDNLLEITDSLFSFSYKNEEEKQVTINGTTATKKVNVLSKSGNNFKNSWNDVLTNYIKVADNGWVNNFEDARKNLYINFSGVKIKFKENLAAWFNGEMKSF